MTPAYNNDTQPDKHWALDRKVPLALIIAIFAQSMGFAWAASSLWYRVGELEHKVENAAPQAERIIRLETKVDVITSTLTEIKALIGRRNEQTR